MKYSKILPLLILSVFAWAPLARATMVPLYHYYNSSNNDHFYTTNYSELGTGAFGWNYVDVICHVSDTSTEYNGALKIPLYEYVNNGRHFFTTNYNRLGAGAANWTYVKIACYVWYLTAYAWHVGSASFPMTHYYRYIHTSDLTFFYSTDNTLAGGGWVLDNYPYSEIDGNVNSFTDSSNYSENDIY